MIKRIVLIAVLMLICSLFTGTVVNASDGSEQPDELSRIARSINDKLNENTDDETRKILGDFKIDVSSSDGVSSLSFGSIISSLISIFFGNLSSPASMLGKLIAAAVLCTLAQSISDAGSGINEVFRILGTLAVILTIYDCIKDSIDITLNCLNELNVFMISYIPIYSGIISASGGAGASVSYYGGDLFLCECAAFAAKSIIAPLVSVLLAASIVGAVNPDVKLGNIAAAVKKAIQWMLGMLMTVFTGLLTIQNAVGASADSIKSKAVRFAASSFIPIIGSSVSETYSALKGSLGMIRTGTGAVGVIIIAAIVLRPIIILLTVRAVLALGKVFCEILGQNEMADLAGSINSILAIGMSLLICFSMMFIISTCIIMMTAARI